MSGQRMRALSGMACYPSCFGEARKISLSIRELVPHMLIITLPVFKLYHTRRTIQRGSTQVSFVIECSAEEVLLRDHFFFFYFKDNN